MERTEAHGALSRELGERGDLIACLTSQIGVELEQGRPVPDEELEELVGAIDDVETLLDGLESGRPKGLEQASAD